MRSFLILNTPLSLREEMDKICDKLEIAELNIAVGSVSYSATHFELVVVISKEDRRLKEFRMPYSNNTFVSLQIIDYVNNDPEIQRMYNLRAFI